MEEFQAKATAHQKNTKARLTFAKKYLDFPKTFGQYSVDWWDKSWTFGRCVSRYIWRKTNTTFHKRNIIPKPHGGDMMVCFAASGHGWLAIMMEPWILHSIRNPEGECRHQFVTSSSSALWLCSRTMIPKTPASPLWMAQVNKIKIWSAKSKSGLKSNWDLWHDLKQSFHAWKPSNVAELKQFCKKEWAKIPPQRCERLIASFTNAWLQLLLQRVAQPVIRFRGNYFFT